MAAGRKAVVLAVVALTIIFLLQSSWTRTSSRIGKTANSGEISDAVRNPARKEIQSDAGSPSSSSDSQHPLIADSQDDLHARLARQFPYSRDGKFPAYIWQTWRFTPSEGGFDNSFRQAEASWSIMHPGFVHEVVTDRNAVFLLRYLYASIPEVIEAYDALPMAVMKADFFRYLILLARGGIYTDIDTYAIKSALEWLPAAVPRASVGLVVGIEADPDREDWQEWYSRRIQLCQWTIQAKAGHPVLRNIVVAITEKVLALKDTGELRSTRSLYRQIVDLTGPAIWTDVIFSYLNDANYFRPSSQEAPDGKSARLNVTWEAFTHLEAPKKVGDVVVLPITCFSPGVQQMGAKEPDDPMAYVKHEFIGKVYDDAPLVANERFLETRVRTHSSRTRRGQEESPATIMKHVDEVLIIILDSLELSAQHSIWWTTLLAG